MQKRFITFSGFSGALAIALGAMGAHFLKSQVDAGILTAANLQSFETGVRYHVYHSIVILFIGLTADRFNNTLVNKAAYCFMIGTVLFSGSIYLLSTANLIGFTAIHWLGPITPLGGLFFIAGWLLLAAAGIKHR